jgi:hypothetical protein
MFMLLALMQVIELNLGWFSYLYGTKQLLLITRS